MGRRGVKAVAMPAETRAQRQGSQRDGVQEDEQGSNYKTSLAFNFSWGHRGNKGDRSSVRERRGQHPPPQPLSSLPGEPGPTTPHLTSVALRALLGSY